MSLDAFGRNFFNMVALYAASLWPIFFALAWMQYRFSEIEFPIFGVSVGYAFTYFLMYVLARILFENIKHRLPYFRSIQKVLKEYDRDAKRMITIADIVGGNDKKVAEDCKINEGKKMEIGIKS